MSAREFGVFGGHNAYVIGIAWTALGFCADATARVEPPRAPFVTGAREPSLSAVDRGSILLRELGCVHCHRDPAAPSEANDSRQGPDLSSAVRRLGHDYLERFIADPGKVDPGTTMPSTLHALPAGERAVAANALAEFLRSIAVDSPPTPVAADLATATDDIAQGKILYHQIGCVACHAPRDDSARELSLAESEPLPDLRAKYSTSSLQAFLLDPEAVRHDSRMPNLRLTPPEAHAIASYLRDPSSATEARATPSTLPHDRPLDPDRIVRGRDLFATIGCAACHVLGAATSVPAPIAPRMDQLQGSVGGCVADEPGAVPHYGLDAGQRADLRAALASRDEPASGERRIRLALLSRGCLACHTRDEIGGIDPARNAYFTTNDPSLGEHARVPPTLTVVGAKLQTDWLRESIAYGQSIRPYLNTRMPGFGVEFATALADDLATTDVLPPLVLPEPPADDARFEQTRKLGCELVGENAMNCIMCHTFAGERVGPVGAVDLIESSGQRLRREWFHHFLLKPSSVSPGTLMPEYYLDGISTRPEVGGGDAAQQIDAMWYYLAEGRNARKPPGLRQPPLEIVVENEAVLLRRSAQGSGKRAISVGYPGDVNLSFDAETLAVTRIWWGGFVDASGVWYGQGSGETRPLGDRIATLPKGPVFARLENKDAPWPIASRRDLGGRWLGYDLEGGQRSPTFRYEFEGIAIADTAAPFAAASTAGKSASIELRRSLEFEATSAVNVVSQSPIQFLVARDNRIEEVEVGRFVVGESLAISLPPGSAWIRDSDRGRELIATIALVENRATLTIDYSWLRGAR